MRRSAAALLLAVATPAALLVATPAHADAGEVERQGRCSGATWELSVDRERGGFDVDVDLEDAAPGSAWRVVLRHEGRTVHDRVVRADREGELDVERRLANTPGRDRVALRLQRAGSAGACGTTVVTR